MSISARNSVSRFTNRMMYILCIGCAVVIVGMLGLIVGYLFTIGFKTLNWQFFAHTQENDSPGMLNAIGGTSILVALASLIGIPVGMLAGVHLAEYDATSRLAAPVRFIADVLAGVPSIVVGILGYELVVVPCGGFSGWAGALALAFIMIPIVARTTEEMLRLVPNSYREASIALGATKANTILNVVIPSATGSIVTGVLLAVARVAGETAPLLFTAGYARYIVNNPARPFPSLTIGIYELSNDPDPKLNAMAWTGILVLISLIFVVNVGVRFFTRQRRFG